MKTISKIRLNNLNKITNPELSNKQMQTIRGGECGWKCFWYSGVKAVNNNKEVDCCPAYGCQLY